MTAGNKRLSGPQASCLGESAKGFRALAFVHNCLLASATSQTPEGHRSPQPRNPSDRLSTRGWLSFSFGRRYGLSAQAKFFQQPSGVCITPGSFSQHLHPTTRTRPSQRRPALRESEMPCRGCAFSPATAGWCPAMLSSFGLALGIFRPQWSNDS